MKKNKNWLEISNYYKNILKVLLLIGSFFFLAEFFLHFFGLSILEHDKIFIMTHDRYIAIFALTYSVLLFIIYTNLKKYSLLFKITMIGILFSIINATSIAYNGGYIKFFPVINLDYQLGIIGIFAYSWYILIFIFWFLSINSKNSKLVA